MKLTFVNRTTKLGTIEMTKDQCKNYAKDVVPEVIHEELLEQKSKL